MVNTAIQKAAESALEPALRAAIAGALGVRSIVLVGMMGAGKSSVGRRLATRLGLNFIDADTEIETAAGMTIPEIFALHGEPYFRAGEARVIARLLDHGPQVLATGGGAVMDSRTRDLIHIKGISIWLKADLDVLSKRTRRRGIGERPLADRLRELLPLREPVYAMSDITVQSRDAPHDVIVDEIIAELPKHLGLSSNIADVTTPEMK
ncbi:MAG: shikimate kinase [Pseudolabrys sp.]|jgi:shikimate kinase